MNLKRRRIKAYVDVISELVLSENPSRELAIKLIKDRLESEGIEPFRGASKPDDIYEKELISLYIIASKGLGIKEDYPDVFSKVFTEEMKYEIAVNILNSNKDKKHIRGHILELFNGSIDGSIIAKILRFAVTLYYLNFENHKFVINTIRRFYDVFPEHEDTIRRFTKFFIAIKIAEDIALGSIKNRIDKEIVKQLISLETGVPKSTPSDEYVAKVAKIVYDIPQKVLDSILMGKTSPKP